MDFVLFLKDMQHFMQLFYKKIEWDWIKCSIFANETKT